MGAARGWRWQKEQAGGGVQTHLQTFCSAHEGISACLEGLKPRKRRKGQYHEELGELSLGEPPN